MNKNNKLNSESKLKPDFKKEAAPCSLRLSGLFMALAGAGMAVYGYSHPDPVVIGTATTMLISGTGLMTL